MMPAIRWYWFQYINTWAIMAYTVILSINCLAQDCGISFANALEIPQSSSGYHSLSSGYIIPWAPTECHMLFTADSDLDGVEPSTEKLTHPTANRVRAPSRRLPTVHNKENNQVRNHIMWDKHGGLGLALLTSFFVKITAGDRSFSNMASSAVQSWKSWVTQRTIHGGSLGGPCYIWVVRYDVVRNDNKTIS